MTDVSAPVVPPAALVPAADLPALVAQIAAGAAAELNTLDRDALTVHAGTAADLVAAELDRPEPWPATDLPSAVFGACVTVTCDLARRPGFAFGVLAVGEAGAPMTVGRDPIAAVRGQLRPFRARWGIA